MCDHVQSTILVLLVLQYILFLLSMQGAICSTWSSISIYNNKSKVITITFNTFFLSDYVIVLLKALSFFYLNIISPIHQFNWQRKTKKKTCLADILKSVNSLMVSNECVFCSSVCSCFLFKINWTW